MDSACGYAALSTMPDNYDVLSVEFKVNLLDPPPATNSWPGAGAVCSPLAAVSPGLGVPIGDQGSARPRERSLIP